MKIHRGPGRALTLPAFAAAALAIAGCRSPAVMPEGGAAEIRPVAPADGFRRVTAAGAYEAVSGGRAVMVDVRDTRAFADGHIRGAEPIALGELAARSGELPRDRTIVLYCSCPAEEASLEAAELLLSLGMRDTAVLVGGYPAWKKAGYPVSEPPN